MRQREDLRVSTARLDTANGFRALGVVLPRSVLAWYLMIAMRRFTYADIESLPEGVTGELIDGELYTQPRPAGHHQVAASILGAKLINHHGSGPGSPPEGWIIVHEIELHLGEDVLVPDISVWRRSRLAAIGRVPFVTVAPNWLCEVLSPGTSRKDRAKKLPAYHRQGLDHVWLVDPDAETLEVYRRATEGWTLVGAYDSDAKVHAEPFVDLEIDVATLWRA